jgi:hypothetical protein
VFCLTFTVGEIQNCPSISFHSWAILKLHLVFVCNFHYSTYSPATNKHHQLDCQQINSSTCGLRAIDITMILLLSDYLIPEFHIPLSRIPALYPSECSNRLDISRQYTLSPSHLAAAYLLLLHLGNWAVARRLLARAELIVVGRPGHSVGVGLRESLLGK